MSVVSSWLLVSSFVKSILEFSVFANGLVVAAPITPLLAILTIPTPIMPVAAPLGTAA